MSFHNKRKSNIPMISMLGKKMKRRRADNGLTWKDSRGKTISFVLIGILFFAGTIGIWLLLSSIASGQGR